MLIDGRYVGRQVDAGRCSRTVQAGVVGALAQVLGAALGALTGTIHVVAKVPSFIVSLGMWYIGLGVAAMLFGYEMIPFLSNEAAVAWPTQSPVLC